MANYCFTDYVVEGKVEEIDGFGKLLEKLPANGDERSLNVIRKAFGEVSGGDGSLYGIEKDGFTLVFSTCTRWQPANDVFVAVKRHFPSLRFYYYAEESNDEVFLTNDADQRFFKHFMMECDDDRQWLATEGEMLVALAKKARNTRATDHGCGRGHLRRAQCKGHRKFPCGEEDRSGRRVWAREMIIFDHKSYIVIF